MYRGGTDVAGMVTAITTRVATGLILFSVLLTSCAQLMFRYSVQGLHLPGSISIDGMISSLISITGVEFLILSLGILFYLTSMISWLFALTRFDVSLAYPMMSISYVLVFVGGVAIPVLNESASMSKIMGIGLIVLGVSVISINEKRGSSI